MTYLWLRGPHRILIAFLALLYLAIAVTAWKIAFPFLAVVVTVTLIRRSRRVKRNKAGAASLLELYRLSPEHFEHRVMEILASNGWDKLKWIGGPGDMGADVTGLDPSGRYCIVQAKRYRPGFKIGSPIVQSLIGSCQLHHADHSVLVTTASFTPAAMHVASLGGVELVDGVGLVTMARVGDVRV